MIIGRRFDNVLKAYFIIFLVFLLGGCTRRFAVVHIVTKDVHTQSSVSAKLYSGKDGLFLGESPLTLKLVKPVHSTTLSIVVKEESYPLHWGIFEISNWARNKRDAADVTYKNDILFMIKKKTVGTEE